MSWRWLSRPGRHLLNKAFPLCAAGFATKHAFSACPVACDADKKSGDNKEQAFWLAGASEGSQSVMACNYDLYGGVIVDPASVPKDRSTFRELLRSSLVTWRGLEKKGVWLQIGIEHSYLIPIATTEFGFEFHHAEKRHVMLTNWLPTHIPNTLPMNASHTVGVGAIVTDAEQRVLLVREKNGPAARLGIWKLPTGLVDAGEEIHAAAVREVKEETGVDAVFEFLGAFITNHGGNLAHAGKTNLFFTAKCKAISTKICVQENEIAEARWFTAEEWQQMPFPEKDSVWELLNSSVLHPDARMEAKLVPVGNNRPGHRWFYYPTPKSSL